MIDYINFLNGKYVFKFSMVKVPKCRAFKKAPTNKYYENRINNAKKKKLFSQNSANIMQPCEVLPMSKVAQSMTGHSVQNLK